MRLIFMGTPEFALPSLNALHQSGRTILAVVTQPDRPKGRGEHLAPPPAKVMAERFGLPVLQPAKIKDPVFLDSLRALKPEMIVVVAFGRILPHEILDLPPRGCVNLHASLLPNYRGAAPIQWAIINGESETGVTTIRMDPGMDTGDILLHERVAILPEDTAGSLSGRLAEHGADLLLRTLKGIESGDVVPTAQDHSAATMAPMLEKESGEIDWAQPAVKIVNRIRGLSPWPGAYTFYQDERWRIWKAAYEDKAADGLPGTILKTGREEISVATGWGLLEILELQPENGRRMGVRDFLAGHSVEPGVVLGQ
ncbi:MAG: methionyl-tRNA formyltransferase [Nitrospirae bacterium]|nr:methionyl-tRNA formyltransferase [Nitrospirota bacterium]